MWSWYQHSQWYCTQNRNSIPQFGHEWKKGTPTFWGYSPITASATVCTSVQNEKCSCLIPPGKIHLSDQEQGKEVIWYSWLHSPLVEYGGASEGVNLSINATDSHSSYTTLDFLE